MSETVQNKLYASSPITANAAVSGAGKIIVGAHNLNAAAAQTATVVITDAASGATIGAIPALGAGAFWTPPLPGITVPSGTWIATPSAGPSGSGIAIFSSTVG
jgi:hypothetical protein